ncbi:MAG: 50S ribosomal protein L1 [Planctomycetes bacterium]|nr:50S ribosomal protein L1 [Planctomycetota bacterium]
MRKHSKRYRAAAGKRDRRAALPLAEALALLKGMPAARFDETVEIALKLGIDPKQSDQMVRGAIALPKGIGKKKRVIVFAEGDKAEEALAAGAQAAGGPELAKKIEDGWLDFDVAIAVPAAMRFVGKLGKVLGPKGKMPSPKAGTVTDNVGLAVREFTAGKIEFRTDAGGNVHGPMGKKSFPVEDLRLNIEAFLGHVKSLRPPAAKGNYIENVSLSTTMGPGIRVQVPG